MDGESDFYVQYGCGLSAPATWTSFDISPTLRLQKIPLLGALTRRRGVPTFPRNVRYGDIVKGLPISPESCKAIYCSHVLEHLALDDFHTALRNTFKSLRPGGTFRFVLPDLELLAREYVQSDDSQAASNFMRETYLGHQDRPRGLEGLLRQWLGNSAHLWMWDYKGMAKELADTGFTQIRRADFGDASDPRFKDVEDPARWNRGLGVQCVRP